MAYYRWLFIKGGLKVMSVNSLGTSLSKLTNTSMFQEDTHESRIIVHYTKMNCYSFHKLMVLFRVAGTWSLLFFPLEAPLCMR